jgi:RNA-binding protein 26
MIPSSTITKKDAAKKAAMEIHRKKQGLLEEQIQQQKALLKKLEIAESNTEKESIRSLMKQVDTTIVMLKDSLRLTPPVKLSSSTTAVAAAPPPPTKPTSTPKISQQDALKQRAKTLQKQLETLRAKTSADMVKYFENSYL